MKSKVSIIIPVFNAESTLEKCIDSMLCQTFSEWELILVNDGSSDHSGIICEEYAKKDNRISVFHKEHGGCSSARNYGLVKAESPRIVFADSDDYVGEFWLEHLMIDEYSDLIVTGYIVHEGERVFESIPDTVDSIPELIGCLGSSMTLGWSCRLCFERSHIMDYCIRFNEKYKVLEDECFVSEYLKYVRNIKVNPVADYHYLKEENSTKYEELWNDDVYFDIAKNIFDILNRNSSFVFKELNKIKQVKIYYIVAMYESYMRALKKMDLDRCHKYFESLCLYTGDWKLYPRILLFHRWLYPIFHFLLNLINSIIIKFSSI